MTTRKIGNTYFQGSDEELSYTLETTRWGTNPSQVVVKIYDISSGARVDVSLTKLSGTPSVVNDVITLPIIKALEPYHNYRVEIKFSAQGNVFEAYFDLFGEH